MKYNEKFKKAQEEKARIAALMSPKPSAPKQTLSPQPILERKNSEDLKKVKNDLILEKEQLMIDEKGNVILAIAGQTIGETSPTKMATSPEPG